MQGMAALSLAGAPRKRRSQALAALAAIGGLLLAAAGEVWLSQQRELAPAIWLLIGGGVAFIVAASFWWREKPPAWIVDRLVGLPSCWAAAGRGASTALLVAAGLGLAAGVRWDRDGFGDAGGTIAAVAWAFALLLAAAVFIRASLPRRVEDGSADGPSGSVWQLALFLMLLGALALRLYRVQDVPYGVWFDEAEMGLEARRLAAGAAYQPLSDNFAADPSLLFYLVAAAFRVFGDSLVSLRLVIALCGALNAPLAALLGRELFGWRAGLIAGVLVGIDRWHLSFSRFGLVSITAPLVATLVLWLFARALRRRGWAEAGLAGLAAGLVLHVYAGARPVLLVMPVVFALAVLRERWPLRLALARGGVMLATAVLVALPILVIAARQPEAYFKRPAQVSIFAQKTGLQAQLAAIGDSTKRHLLMFHYQGDNNGRHNVPGMPMVDPILGVPLVLGLVWCLRHVGNWRYLAPLLLAAGSLALGILSLDFEAPQGSRTIGVAPAVALMGALGLLLLLEPATAIARRVRVPRAAALAAASAAVALGFVAWRTVDVYFTRQATGTPSWLSFSTAETAAAREIQRQGAAFPRLIVDDRFLGSPVFRFLVPGRVEDLKPFSPSRDLPLKGANAAALILVTDKQQAQEVLRYYPEAELRAFSAPQEPDVVAVTEVAIGAEQIQARRGLPLVEPEDDESTASGLSGARLEAPQAVWAGGLTLERTGDYDLAVPDGYSLSLDGESFPGAGQPGGVRLHLARGSHALRVAGESGEAGPAPLRWRPPGRSEWAPIPPESLFGGVEGGTGLLGRVFRNAEWSGSPAVEQVDPVLSLYFHQSPVARPRSVEWTGALEAPVTGTYRIGVEQISRSEIWIDGSRVLSNDRQNSYQDTSLRLRQGRHALRVRFQDVESFSHIYLYWTPPGGNRAIIPGRYLYPPAPIIVSGSGSAAAPPEGEASTSGDRRLDPSEPLQDAHGVGIDPRSGAIYMADSGNARLVAYSAAGVPRTAWSRAGAANAPLREPFDVAVDRQGRVFVLDSEQGVVYRFSADGQLQATLLAEAALYRPRGVTVDSRGELYVADTGNNRILRVSPDGEIRREWGPRTGVDLDQPTAAVADAEGNLYVAEPTLRRVRKLGEDGRTLATRALAVANTREGAHLALRPDGLGIVLTDPGAARVWLLDGALSQSSLLKDGAAEGLNPVGVAVAPTGEVWIADPSRPVPVRLGVVGRP